MGGDCFYTNAKYSFDYETDFLNQVKQKSAAVLN